MKNLPRNWFGDVSASDWAFWAVMALVFLGKPAAAIVCGFAIVQLIFGYIDSRNERKETK